MLVGCGQTNNAAIEEGEEKGWASHEGLSVGITVWGVAPGQRHDLATLNNRDFVCLMPLVKSHSLLPTVKKYFGFPCEKQSHKYKYFTSVHVFS